MVPILEIVRRSKRGQAIKDVEVNHSNQSGVSCGDHLSKKFINRKESLGYRDDDWYNSTTWAWAYRYGPAKWASLRFADSLPTVVELSGGIRAVFGREYEGARALLVMYRLPSTYSNYVEDRNEQRHLTSVVTVGARGVFGLGNAMARPWKYRLAEQKTSQRSWNQCQSRQGQQPKGGHHVPTLKPWRQFGGFRSTSWKIAHLYLIISAYRSSNTILRFDWRWSIITPCPSHRAPRRTVRCGGAIVASKSGRGPRNKLGQGIYFPQMYHWSMTLRGKNLLSDCVYRA